mmetsp:Transcript_25054/g.48942  ORF Transcript_25054/g.48942 Transcript_25054/m.48942 type:complete len:211 (-) Transcript_25054:600-1232(-)
MFNRPALDSKSRTSRYSTTQSRGSPAAGPGPASARRASSIVWLSASCSARRRRLSYSCLPPEVMLSSELQGWGRSLSRMGCKNFFHHRPPVWLLPCDPNVYARFTSGMRHARPLRICGSRMASSQNASGHVPSREISDHSFRVSIHPNPGNTSVRRTTLGSLTKADMPLSFHALAQYREGSLSRTRAARVKYSKKSGATSRSSSITIRCA